MAKLSARDIISLAAAEADQTKVVAIEGWGEFVLRKITAAEEQRIREDASGDVGLATKLAIASGIKEPQFTLEEAEALYANTTTERLKPLIEAIVAWNGFGKTKEGAEDSFPKG